MTIHQDRIAQMVESLAETFDEVAAADAIDPGRALSTIDRALADAFRARPETLHLQIDHGLDEIDYRLAAEVGRLLELRADIAARIDDPELADRSHDFAVRALQRGVQTSFHDTDAGVSSPAETLRGLLRDERTAEVLSVDEIAGAWRELFEFEAEQQHFPKAEDCLFHALRLAPDPQPIVEQGRRFYDRLLDLPDEVLERRGLPRDEVEEARRDLEAMSRDS